MPKKINYADMFTLRKDGRYMGYWKEPNGNRHAIYDRDPEKLFQRIQEAEAPKVLLFRDIAEAWHDAAWEIIKPGTKACYDAPYKRALERFGSVPADSIKPADIYAHLVDLNKLRMSSRVIKTQRTIYRQIYEAAIVNPDYTNLLSVNPAISVPLPPDIKKPVHREAPEDDAVATIRSSAQSAYFGMFTLFLISTGFRRGEALSMRWKDIDFKTDLITCSGSVIFRGTAEVNDTKTAAGVRTVPLLPDIKAALLAAKPTDAKPEHFIFYSSSPDACMTENAYRRHWLHYCKDAGFVTTTSEERTSQQNKKYTVYFYKPTITAHVMRHGYATLLFEAGVDAHTAQKLLGHANIETTLSIYTHLRKRKEDASIAALKAAVNAALIASAESGKNASVVNSVVRT